MCRKAAHMAGVQASVVRFTAPTRSRCVRGYTATALTKCISTEMAVPDKQQAVFVYDIAKPVLLGERAVPSVKSDEVLVRVKAAQCKSISLRANHTDQSPSASA
jgi:hypothetical protein